MSFDDVIRTDRLDLVLVDVDQLLALDGEGPLVAPPYRDTGDVFGGDNARRVRLRAAQVRVDPTVCRWLLRVMVLREENDVVGMTNFHDAPDERGMVEIGYQVREEYRRQGLAREAVDAMFGWAAAQPGVRYLRATVSPGNIPSIRVIEGAGLVHVGEQDDDEDGLELVYEVPVARSRYAPAAS